MYWLKRVCRYQRDNQTPKKDRQYNDKKQEDRQNNGKWNTTQKTKVWATQSPLKISDMKEFPAPLVAPVVLLLNDRTTILYGNRFGHHVNKYK
jgi:hypothetical protein